VDSYISTFLNTLDCAAAPVWQTDAICVERNHKFRSWSIVESTSPWCSGKCVRFGAGRSRGWLLAGSYQDLVNWYCSLLTRRTVYGRAAGNTIRTHNQPSENEPRNCTISVLALQDHCSYKAPTTNHHIKQTIVECHAVCVDL